MPLPIKRVYIIHNGSPIAIDADNITQDDENHVITFTLGGVRVGQFPLGTPWWLGGVQTDAPTPD